MDTARRADALARVADGFPLLGPTSADDLLELIALEAGHPEALDGFRPYGSRMVAAHPPSTLLHIVSGNTPHAALQSLLLGLLIGSHNLLKLPSCGIPEVDRFVERLPGPLAERVETGRELDATWIDRAGAVLVFGSDETIASLRGRIPPGKRFLPYGHRVSFGVVFEDPALESVVGAARDVSLFDQRGCLSPHLFYVDESQGLDARSYAAALAQEMEAFQKIEPRGPLVIEESAQILNLRSSYRFRAASDHRVQLWESREDDAWTVLYEEDPWFVSSCLNRVVFVKPLPSDLRKAVGPVLPWIGAIGIWPATPENAMRLRALHPSRICPIGQMQCPPWTWHQEGRPRLAPLLDFIDFEPGKG